MNQIQDITRRLLAKIDDDIRDAIYGGTCSNAQPSPPITAERIMADMERIHRELGPPPPRVKIIESVHATAQGGRVRAYPKRKAKSASHWRRMDKKWRKRYGYHRVPCMWQMDSSWLARCPETTFVVHPSLMPALRHSLRAEGGR